MNPEGLVTWVLSLGRGVQVESPPGIVREIARLARRVADRHSDARPKARVSKKEKV